MELKGRRELFCREYLKDLNGTQAALRAGYSPNDARTYASRLLGEDDIQERIAELNAERVKEFAVEARDVLLELHRMLTSDVALLFDEAGNIKSIDEIPLDLRRMIASVEVFEEYQGAGAQRVYIGRTKKVKLWSKEKGAELLARHLALFNDKLKVDASDDVLAALAAGRARAGELA